MTQNDRTGFRQIGFQRIGFQPIGHRRIALLLPGLAFVPAVRPPGIPGLSGGVWRETGRAACVEASRAIHAAAGLSGERLP